MSSEKPAYVTYGPLVLIIVVAVVVYTLTVRVEKELSSLPGASVLDAIDEVKRVVEDLERILKGARPGDLKPRAERKPDKKRGAARLALKPQAEQPHVILDFMSKTQDSLLKVKSSREARVSFSIDETEAHGGGSVMAAHLSIQSMGERKDKPFASGVITFPEPVTVGSMQALEIKIKGDGVNHFGVAALSKKGGVYLRWDISNNWLGDGWYTVNLPFTLFNLWSYNTESRKYIKLDRKSAPKTIDQVRVYLRPTHLDNGMSGDVWIETIALR